ncbi:hypothetical protein WN943_010588 [Citrus x changshan-huyou]
MSFVCHSHSFVIRALPKPAFVKDFTLSFEHNFYSALEIFEVPVSAIVIASTLDLLINPNNFHCTYLFRQQSPNGRTDFFALDDIWFEELKEELEECKNHEQQRVILKDKKAQVYHSVGQCWVRSDFSMAETWDQG